jgi:hypothetical protein
MTDNTLQQEPQIGIEPMTAYVNVHVDGGGSTLSNDNRDALSAQYLPNLDRTAESIGNEVATPCESARLPLTITFEAECTVTELREKQLADRETWRLS